MRYSNYRFGDFVRTDEESWVNINHIMEVRLEPRGDMNHPDTKHKDEYKVEIVLAMNDLWYPSGPKWSEDGKPDSIFQMSDLQTRDVCKGTKAECQSVIWQIISTYSSAASLTNPLMTDVLCEVKSDTESEKEKS